MCEKPDTGKEVMDPTAGLPGEPPKPKKKTKTDPFDTKRNKLLEKIKENNKIIQDLRNRIELTDSLQSIIGLISGAKVVQPERFLHGTTLAVNLPDLETLGDFFKELELLNSKIPKLDLTYSGKIAGDDILSEVRIKFKRMSANAHAEKEAEE